MGQKYRKFGKTTVNQLLFLIIEDLRYQTEKLEICPAGNNRVTGAKK